MRELGLDALVPDDRSDGSSDGEDENAPDADAETAADGTDGDDGADAPGETDSGDADPNPQPRRRIPADEFEGDVGDAIEELQYDLDDVEGRVTSNETSVESLRNDQDRMADRLDAVEETNATLLGVYDRLTEDINPFSNGNRDDVGPEDATYGVMDGSTPDETPVETADADDEDEPAEDDDVVSFDDLKDDLGADEADDEPAERDAESERAPEPAAAPPPVESGPDTPDSPYLAALAPTYATDVLLMQWMRMLVDTAGPAGALKTLDYYAQINWISPPVKRQLETVLSGAYDVNGERPSRPPSDLSVEAHSESFEHIQRLAQQTELADA